MSFAHFFKIYCISDSFLHICIDFLDGTKHCHLVLPPVTRILRSVLIKIMVKVFQISYVIAQHL